MGRCPGEQLATFIFLRQFVQAYMDQHALSQLYTVCLATLPSKYSNILT